jgi:Peptidase family M1 domain
MWCLRILRVGVIGVAWSALVWAMVAVPVPVRGATAAVHHDLRVELVPERGTLMGVDEMTLDPGGAGAVSVLLNPRAAVSAVAVNGRASRHSFANGMLRLPLPEDARNGKIRISIAYHAVFDDPVPVRPVNTDNPGYGVSGTISERGTLLLSGAGWYPVVKATHETYGIEVTAPAGIVAVTAGESLGRRTADGRTVSTWRVDRPVRGLALSAARYTVTEQKAGPVTVATYFFEGSRVPAKPYLDAAARYIRFYSRLFGPYPFAKFAVVENFFPTGYGFPSYTLMGSRVLALPFIVRTSLGHEIAHCWWGNGVYVDYRSGNWSEGLTTYVSDYFFRERDGRQEGTRYRRQMLRNYATLVDPADDFPLTAFYGRTDPVTKAVGYDKAAMVFHMLRRRIGDERFWGALKDIVATHRFQAVDWSALQAAFERQGRISLDAFFKQWVVGTGAPTLSLKDVGVRHQDGRWQVTGTLSQAIPSFTFTVDVVASGKNDTQKETIEVAGLATPFSLELDEPPIQLQADPGSHLFRRLDSSEIPPAVNRLRGAPKAVLVLAEGAPPGMRNAADLLARGLGLKTYEIIAERRWFAGDGGTGHLIFVGLPQSRALLPPLSPQITIREGRVAMAPVDLEDSDTFFGVFHPTGDPARTVALWTAPTTDAAMASARKIPHYGKYGYLAFNPGGRNVSKGIWPVTDSPLIFRWAQRAKTAAGVEPRKNPD